MYKKNLYKCYKARLGVLLFQIMISQTKFTSQHNIVSHPLDANVNGWAFALATIFPLDNVEMT